MDSTAEVEIIIRINLANPPAWATPLLAHLADLHKHGAAVSGAMVVVRRGKREPVPMAEEIP